MSIQKHAFKKLCSANDVYFVTKLHVLARAWGGIFLGRQNWNRQPQTK